MLLDNLSVNIWLYTEPVDMRKQFDGLAALAQSKLGCRANSGELFVFINRKRTQMKVLYYNQGGYCLWSKRLERGHYQRLQHGTGKMALDWTQLQCLIGGIHWQKATRNKRL
ncbi:IS66 family insertion sequence element accessory protein TnpB [Motilimonas cestriensis]|uniref:IS66 family insertion sequence element accessory protein TnpB n=1 Tax=Motilimonas cestriensis TaxID=2742685 RepID=UPI003DA5E3AC